jgi:Spy/CpxP family protein refolding chaperone
MKLVKMMMIVAFAALLTGTLAIAQAGGDKPAAPKGEGKHGGGNPAAMLDNLLPPHLLDELKLTAEQKTKFDDLQAAFKKDADKWKSAHPDFQDQMQAARKSEDKEAVRTLMEQRKPLMEARKASVDKLRESLTAEQKDTLDKAMEQVRNRRGPGGPGGPGGGGPKGDQPPPPPKD